MQLFARTNPKDVMGLILIDSIHAEQYKRFEDAGIEIVDLDQSMILEIVKEGWHRIQGTWKDTDSDLCRFNL